MTGTVFKSTEVVWRPCMAMPGWLCTYGETRTDGRLTYDLRWTQLLPWLELYLLRTTVSARRQPPVVCLCGSTRFGPQLDAESARLTLEGAIVLRPHVVAFADHLKPETKAELDELHLRKIELADEIRVVDVGGYVGKSTRREVEHARNLGRRVTYLSESPPPPSLLDAVRKARGGDPPARFRGFA